MLNTTSTSRASRGPDGTFSPSFGYSLYSKSRPIGTFQTVSLGTSVNEGKKKDRGGARPRPSSLRGLARVWRMGFASARHLVRLSGHTAGIIDGRTGQADGKMYWTSRHNSFPGALYRT